VDSVAIDAMGSRSDNRGRSRSPRPRYQQGYSGYWVRRAIFDRGLSAIEALPEEDYEWLRTHTHKGKCGRAHHIDRWSRLGCISFAMVLAARHARTDEAVAAELDIEGFITIENFLKLKMCQCLRVTPGDVVDVLRDDEAKEAREGKRRFEKRNEGFRLVAFAALQGHSAAATDQMNMDLRLQRMEIGDNRIPDTLLHGTDAKNLDNIWRYGLLAGGFSGLGGRHDVHTVRHTNGMKDRSGVRDGSDAIIFIDGAALRNDQDVKIRLSRNDVFLVERKIPKEYLICAVHRATGERLPMPRNTDKDAKYFQCREGRVISTDEIKRLMGGVGGVSALSTADLKIQIAFLQDKLNQTRARLANANYM
jgi:RNA:NAD 2'-phosphotransferase (TPT1/KptA family)